MQILGDSEGHDKFCGRQMVYSRPFYDENSPGLCRYCDTPYAKMDDPDYKFKWRPQRKVEKLVANKDEDGLKAIGYLNIEKNALHQLTYADERRQLHSALLSELLHCWQHGLHLYAANNIFMVKHLSNKEKSKRKKESKAAEKSAKALASWKQAATDDSDSSLASASEEEVSVSDSDESSAEEDDGLPEAEEKEDKKFNHFNVFDDFVCDQMDERCKEYGRLLQKQSDRDLPRTYFSAGIASKTKKNGHEMQGVIILILVFLVSSQFDSLLENKFDLERLGDLIHMLEFLIMFEEFMKQKSFLRSDVFKVRKFVPKFLDLFKKVVVRSCKFLKFHLPLHLCDDILANGPPLGWCSSTGEKNHKTAVKTTARRTQRKAETLDEQTGLRYAEDITIQRSYGTMRSVDRVLHHAIQEEPPFRKCGLSFFLRGNIIYKYSRNLEKSTPAHWHDQNLQSAIAANLKTTIFLPNDMSGMTVIPIFTRLHKDGEIYRGNPRYKESDWHDWVYVDWGKDGKVPSQILCFIEITDDMRRTDQAIHIDSGVYAMCHSLTQSFTKPPLQGSAHAVQGHKNYKANQSSRLLFWGEKEKDDNGSPLIRIVSVESFHSPCIGVPFNLHNREVHDYIFLRPRSKWTETFISYVKHATTKETPRKQETRQRRPDGISEDEQSVT